MNFFDEKWILRINNPAVIVGTLIPAAVLIALGRYWLLARKHLAAPFSASELKANLSSINNLVFFVGVLATTRRPAARPGISSLTCGRMARK